MATSTANGASRRANRKRHFSKAGGFSLLELAIVITIIALVAGVSIDMGLYTIEVVKEVANNHKLNVIEQALMSYRLTNERLPCPTDASLATTSAYYGYEAGTLSGTQWMPDAGSCITKGTYSNGALTGTTTGSVAANYTFTLPKPPTSTLIAGGTTVAEGAVPFKALHLPESFMYDAWDRKFAYAVWTPMTATATSATSPGGAAVYGMSPSCGAITVNDSSGNHRSTAADYALVSFGPNGHGAYTKSGSRYFSGSDNGNGGAAPQPPAGAGEWTDCHCNATGDTGYLATYVQKRWTEDPGDSKDTFDDTVRFKERWQMTDKHDFFVPKANPCYPGFAVNGNYSTNGSNAAMALALGDVNGDGIPDLIIGAPSVIGSSTGAVYVVFGSKQGFPDPLPLSSCNGTNCAEFDGARQTAFAGWSVATGDVNGDGIADIIIGATNAANGYDAHGGAYVIFGHSGAWNSTAQTLNSTFLNGINGFALDGPANYYSTGSSVAVGDVNGDGIPDILIGALAAGNGVAEYYLYFNGHNPTPGEYVTLGNAPTVNWTFVTTCTGGNTVANCALNKQTNIGATSVATATNLVADLTASTNTSINVATYTNGSGTSDQLMIDYNTPGTVGNSYTVDVSGFPGAAGNQRYTGYGSGSAAYQGAIYVVYGGRTGAGNSAGTAWTSCKPCTLNGTFLNGVNGVELDGQTTNQGIGSGLAAGDVNGDGIADLAIGTGLFHAGGCCVNDQAFLVFGKRTSLLPQTTVTTTNGSTCATAGSDSGLIGGQAVSSSSFPTAGLYISAIGGSCSNGGGSCSGNTCLTLSGTASATASGATMYVSAQPLNATYLNGTNGVEFDTGTWDSGATAVAIGDVNGDGTGDLVVGAHRSNAGGCCDTGAVYVVFGKSGGWPTTATNLYSSTYVNGLNAVGYIRYSGGDNLGFTVNTGDVNGDRKNDLILANGSNKLYTIFGQSSLLPQTTITTTNGFASATVASFTGLMVGQTISASNLQAGTTILDCGGGTACTSTSITLSKSATGGDGSTPVPMNVSIQSVNSTFLNGIYGVELDGIGNGTQYATVNVTAGDINGDGIADIIGANPTINTSSGPSHAGQVYVYFGKKYLWPTSPYTLTNLCSGC